MADTDDIETKIRQAMTPYLLTLNRLDGDVRDLKDVVFGNSTTRRVGLVEQIASIMTKLDSLIDEGEKRKYLLWGIAIGLGLTSISSIGTLVTVLRVAATGAP